MIPSRTTLIPALLATGLLVGCAPGQMLIDRADLAGMEERLDRQELLLAEFEQQQKETQERLASEQSQSRDALLESMNQGFARLSRDVTALRAVAANRDSGNTAQRESQPVLQIQDRQVVGAIEKVWLSPPGLRLEARIDTGANSASLDARNMQEFERDGRRWVRFDLVERDTDNVIVLERPVVRRVRIYQSTSEEAERRPVIELQLTIGEVTQTTEFTLSDRSHLNFPVLIGRNVLKDLMVVDVSREYVAPPKIPAAVEGQ